MKPVPELGPDAGWLAEFAALAGQYGRDRR
jgi:hypothetical protein